MYVLTYVYLLLNVLNVLISCLHSMPEEEESDASKPKSEPMLCYVGSNVYFIYLLCYVLYTMINHKKI
jgi:hypothetical protein